MVSCSMNPVRIRAVTRLQLKKIVIIVVNRFKFRNYFFILFIGLSSHGVMKCD